MPRPRKPDWAAGKVPDLCMERWQHAEVSALLRAEHRRAVRIVQKVAGAAIEESMDVDQYDAYMQACSDILAALKRGRSC